MWDPALQRVTIVAPDGEVVGTTPIRGPGEIELAGRRVPAFPTELHGLSGGATVADLGFPTAVMTRGPDGVHRDTVPLSVYDRHGELAATIGPIPGAETWVKNGSSMLLPLGHRLLVSTAGGEVFVGTGRGPIEGFAPTGDPVRTIEVPVSPAPVTEERFAAMKEAWSARMGPGGVGMMQEMLAGLPRPEVGPAYVEIAGSADGDLWARAFRDPSHPLERWIVLDPDGSGSVEGGAARFQVEVDAGLRLLDIARDYVLVLATDSLGVEQVRLHPLVPK